MADDTQGFMQKRREEIVKQRNAVKDKIEALEAELAGFDKELRAIDAFETTMGEDAEPAPALAPKKARRSKAKDTPVERAPRGERRGQLLEIIKRNAGISAAEIITELGADTKAGAAIRSALYNMAKGANPEVTNDGGKYTAV